LKLEGYSAAVCLGTFGDVTLWKVGNEGIDRRCERAPIVLTTDGNYFHSYLTEDQARALASMLNGMLPNSAP
jgi:hypothetical protein